MFPPLITQKQGNKPPNHEERLGNKTQTQTTHLHIYLLTLIIKSLQTTLLKIVIQFTKFSQYKT